MRLVEHDEATTQISLTEQEISILRLIAAGQSTNEIAESLGLKPPTVMWYRPRPSAQGEVRDSCRVQGDRYDRCLRGAYKSNAKPIILSL